MSKVDEVVRKIDWTLLREQKDALLGSDSDEAHGLLNLLDNLQDAALADALATVEQIFGRYGQ